MKISTKTGDGGTCALMFGERVSKASPRVAAYGTVDEFCAALGAARAKAQCPKLKGEILEVQNSLIKLMTELATSPKNFGRLAEKNIGLLDDGDLAKIEAKISKMEAEEGSFSGWKMPGETELDAAFNLARAICRRAERETARLNETEPLPRDFPLRYLNRLSDLAYLWAVRAARAPGK